jgi:hypothetical protein
MENGRSLADEGHLVGTFSPTEMRIVKEPIEVNINVNTLAVEEQDSIADEINQNPLASRNTVNKGFAGEARPF